ncbi:MAG: ABC transporter ATP-binding protein [Actinomycetota bacterium]
MATLSLRQVAKSYGVTPVVGDLTLEIPDGELFVLVGPSGSGKSTILRLIAGLERPNAGEIQIGDRDVTRLDARARNVGMVFQSYALFPHMDVRENIAFGLRARRIPDADIARAVASVAEALDIAALLDRVPANLSGGERQRVALARALARNPDVLLMDEPLSNLDTPLRAQTRAEIVRLQSRFGTTTVYVTHDQIEALGMGHRIGVLHDGSLEQVGSPQEIYERPATLFVARFIGSPAMNVLRARASGSTLLAEPVRAALARAVAPTDVLAGIRPEHVHVEGSRWSGRPDGAQTFQACVDLVESAGDQVFLTLSAGEHTLVARVEPSFRPAPGSNVQAWLDPNRVHLFDPDTERALTPKS